MALFNKRDLLASTAQTRASATSYAAILESIQAKEALQNCSKAFNSLTEYDVFLSHSYDDKVLINNLRKSLTDLGFSVYVDWIDDSELDRSKVTKDTALMLRARMQNCKCLFYATSVNSNKSKWMPWELGYFDGHKGRVAILPIVDTPESTFTGQEYLGVYPYVDKTGTSLWIHENVSKYVEFKKWLAGSNP